MEAALPALGAAATADPPQDDEVRASFERSVTARRGAEAMDGALKALAERARAGGVLRAGA